MEDKTKAMEMGRAEQATALNEAIKKKVKAEKIRAKLDSLEEIDRDGYKWDGLKRFKSKLTPTFCKFKDKQGNRIPADKYAEKAGDYLETKQWAKAEDLPPTQHRDPLPQLAGDEIKDTEFEADELDEVIRKLKHNKAPGPDTAVTELFKWTDAQTRGEMLKPINEVWSLENGKNGGFNAVSNSSINI